MSNEFDPYRQWLGISKDEPRPLSYYRLLGIEKFESDVGVIANSAERQIKHLRKYNSSDHGKLAELLINELIKAKLVLIKQDRREAYNRTLLTPQENSGLPNSFTERDPQARPVPPAKANARVEGLVPPESAALPVAPPLAESASPGPPLYAYTPTGPAGFPAPYQPYQQPPVTYAQGPVPYPPGSYPPAPLLSTALPVAYYPPQQAGSGPYSTTGLIPPHLVSQAHVSVASPLPDAAEELAESNVDLFGNAAQFRARHDSLRQRRIYRHVALSGALALMILGTVVGLVVSQ